MVHKCTNKLLLSLDLKLKCTVLRDLFGARFINACSNLYIIVGIVSVPVNLKLGPSKSTYRKALEAKVS